MKLVSKKMCCVLAQAQLPFFSGKSGNPEKSGSSNVVREVSGNMQKGREKSRICVVREFFLQNNLSVVMIPFLSPS